jgi:hypothetical protein
MLLDPDLDPHSQHGSGSNSQLNADPRGSRSITLSEKRESVCIGTVDPDPGGPGTFFEPVGSVSGMVLSGNTDRKRYPQDTDIFNSSSHAVSSKKTVFWTSRRTLCWWLSWCYGGFLASKSGYISKIRYCRGVATTPFSVKKTRYWEKTTVSSKTGMRLWRKNSFFSFFYLTASAA